MNKILILTAIFYLKLTVKIYYSHSWYHLCECIVIWHRTFFGYRNLITSKCIFNIKPGERCKPLGSFIYNSPCTRFLYEIHDIFFYKLFIPNGNLNYVSSL